MDTINNEDLVANAEANVVATVEAEKAARESVKEAKANHKQAIAYEKSLGDEDEGKADAAETISGWANEVERRTAAAAEAKEAIKAARAAVKEAKAAAKEAKKAEDKPAKVEQNGQVQPRPTSKSGMLWAIFDAASVERGSPCAVIDVMDQCQAHGLTDGTIRSIYSHWRKFHGIAGGRIPSVNAADMSEEKRAEALAKATAQLEKAEARVAALREKIATLTPSDEA